MTKLTPAQVLLRDGGCPPALFMTAAQRAEAWVEHPPRPMPLYVDKPRGEDAATIAFREQVEAERRQKSLNSIAKMKTKFASKAIDYSKMRWDPRRSKFVEDHNPVQVAKPLTSRPGASSERGAARLNREFKSPDGGQDWSHVNAVTARQLAELNGVWNDKYGKLSGGLLVMTVINRLKGLVNKGGAVKWS